MVDPTDLRAMTILPVRTALGIVPEAEYQSGYVEYPGCNCPTATHIHVVAKGVVTVATSGIDGNDYFRTPNLMLPWSSSGGVPIGNWFLGAEWSNVDGLKFGGAGIDFGSPFGATPAFIWNLSESGNGQPLPSDGDNYELHLWYLRDQGTGFGKVNSTMALYINGVDVGRVNVYGLSAVASGFAVEYDAYAPPCLPTPVSGGTVNTGVPFTITITDLGSNTYRVRNDDPNQSGFLSDPGLGLNNDGGAAGQCLPSGAGAPCATDASLPVQSVSIVGPDLATRTIFSHPATVTAYSSGASGSGWFIQVDYDLTDQAIVDLEVGGWSAAARQHRNALAQWVTDFGSGVAVTVNAASTFPVECFDTVAAFPASGRVAFPAGYGFTVFGVDDPNPGTPSSVTEFRMACTSAPTPGFTTLTPTLDFFA